MIKNVIFAISNHYLFTKKVRIMKKIMMIAALMVVAVTASAQRSPGDQTLKPFVGFNLANLAGDINDNSIKFAIAAEGTNVSDELARLNTNGRPAWMNWVIVLREYESNEALVGMNNPDPSDKYTPWTSNK